MSRQPHRRGPRRRVTRKIARQRRLKHDAKRRRGEQLETRLLLATDVTGTLTEDATWNGTIRVRGAGVTVADGVTVTIEPGTVIKSELGAVVNAVGVIDAIGTPAEPIIFTSVGDDTAGEDLTPDAATVPLPGAWETLLLGDGASQLTHVEVRYADTREEANQAFDAFVEVYELKHLKAVACLKKDRDELLAFYDFPAEHWPRLRATNPIESTFATIRLRHRRTKSCSSRIASLTMMFQLAQSASKRWRALNDSHLLPNVLQGKTFQNGLPPQQAAA